jgi:hypothetical protein
MMAKSPDLDSYRKAQRNLAILRDNGLCAVCYFVKAGIKVPANDVHHVYGRGRKAGNWRESFKCLLCVCRMHHPRPILVPGGNSGLAWIEDVLKSANETPINQDFSYGEDNNGI